MPVHRECRRIVRQCAARSPPAIAWSSPLDYSPPDEFEWDQAKSDACLRLRGFSLVLAMEAFSDPDRLQREDVRTDHGEERFQLLGRIGDRVFFVAFTVRGAVCRIISARKANRREIRIYANRTDEEGTWRPAGPG